MSRDVVITGIGLVSSLGIGPEPHRAALTGGAAPVLDETAFAPWPIHPLPAIPYETQVPRRDFRQMETWQRLGVFAAGLALESANAKPLGAMIDLTVAARPGERDIALDETLFAELAGQDPGATGALVNTRLMSNLRPTLFLAELPNLLAGSITIVHGVARSSRTLMGEELAAADALRTAAARIAHGASDIALVGGANNPARWEELAMLAGGGMLWQGGWRPVAERGPAGGPGGGPGGGVVPGGIGAFLVLESAEHAAARGATALAKLARVATAMAKRNRGESPRASAEALLAGLPLRPGAALLSAASGAAGVTQQELDFLAPLGTPRCTGDWLGHGFEASFPAAVALAALAVQAGTQQALVSGFGAWRGEALALVEAA